jgi:hypothetical protein
MILETLVSNILLCGLHFVRKAHLNMVLHWGYELSLSTISDLIRDPFLLPTCEALISMIMYPFFHNLTLLIHGNSYIHILIDASKLLRRRKGGCWFVTTMSSWSSISCYEPTWILLFNLESLNGIRILLWPTYFSWTTFTMWSRYLFVGCLAFLYAAYNILAMCWYSFLFCS